MKSSLLLHNTYIYLLCPCGNDIIDGSSSELLLLLFDDFLLLLMFLI